MCHCNSGVAREQFGSGLGEGNLGVAWEMIGLTQERKLKRRSVEAQERLGDVRARLHSGKT